MLKHGSNERIDEPIAIRFIVYSQYLPNPRYEIIRMYATPREQVQ